MPNYFCLPQMVCIATGTVSCGVPISAWVLINMMWLLTTCCNQMVPTFMGCLFSMGGYYPGMCIPCTKLLECPVEGQLFTRCGSACPPNCTNPSPICTRQCVARCECPRGKVIDERKNKCVPVNQCAGEVEVSLHSI